MERLGYGMDGPASNPSMCKRFFSKTSKPAPKPTQPPMRWVSVLFLGWKTAGLCANCWLPSNAEVREERTCNSTPRMYLRNKLFVAGPLVRRPGLSARTVRLGFYGAPSGTVTPITSIFPPVSVIPSMLHTHWSSTDPVRVILGGSVVQKVLTALPEGRSYLRNGAHTRLLCRLLFQHI